MQLAAHKGQVFPFKFSMNQRLFQFIDFCDENCVRKCKKILIKLVL